MSERQSQRMYHVECGECGWSEKIDGAGDAEREGMSHEDHAGLRHSVTITRERDGRVIHP